MTTSETNILLLLTETRLKLKSDLLLLWSYYRPAGFRNITLFCRDESRRRACQEDWGSMLHTGEATHQVQDLGNSQITYQRTT